MMTSGGGPGSRVPVMKDVDSDEFEFLRSEFLVRLAHELRGATAAGVGAIVELEQSVGVRAEPRLANLLAVVQRSNRKVLRTAERLTRTSELVTRRAEMRPIQCDLRELLTRASREAGLTEGRASVELHLDFPKTPCWIDVDVEWTMNVLAEIVAQALRAARSRVLVAISRDASRVCAELEDDRVGPIDTCEARFSSEASRVDAGLQLAIVRDVMGLHGGEVFREEIHDAAGSRVGARTRVSFPASLGPERPAAR